MAAERERSTAHKASQRFQLATHLPCNCNCTRTRACVCQGINSNHAQTAKFKRTTFLPLLQTMSSLCLCGCVCMCVPRYQIHSCSNCEFKILTFLVLLETVSTAFHTLQEVGCP